MTVLKTLLMSYLISVAYGGHLQVAERTSRVIAVRRNVMQMICVQPASFPGLSANADYVKYFDRQC